jgi:hypothetical protein
MLLAILVTLFDRAIVSYSVIIAGMVVAAPSASSWHARSR